nr:zinc finger protein 771-like [Dermacentor andersoni]
MGARRRIVFPCRSSVRGTEGVGVAHVGGHGGASAERPSAGSSRPCRWRQLSFVSASRAPRYLGVSETRSPRAGRTCAGGRRLAPPVGVRTPGPSRSGRRRVGWWRTALQLAAGSSSDAGDQCPAVSPEPLPGRGNAPRANRDCSSRPDAAAVAAVETNQRRTCLVCHKRFASERKYRSHELRHRSKMLGRYRCDACSKCFVQKSSLVTHARIHTGERPYRCQHCNASFGDVSCYNKHMRVHSGDRPYVCIACNKRFTQSGSTGGLVSSQRNQ